MENEWNAKKKISECTKANDISHIQYMVHVHNVTCKVPWCLDVGNISDLATGILFECYIQLY